jgi:predicted glutamine amidotransferase
MCGLVGVAGDIYHSHKEAFTDMLYVDVVRGAHGTGVASVGSDGVVDFIKRHGPPPDLIMDKRYDRVVTMTKKAIIGHNRHATKGVHSSDNAHPFSFHHVVGAHNGTLPDFSHKKLSRHSHYETDSEALFWELNVNMDAGLPYYEATKEVLKELTGAWALVFYAKKDKRLCMIRNSERPLCYAYSEDKKVLFWASESWMIRGASSRNKIKLFEDKIYMLTEDTLLGWALPTKTGEVFQAPERFKVEGKKYTLNPQLPPVVGGSHGTTKNTNYTVGTGFVKGPAFPTEHKKGHYKPPYKDPQDGHVMTRPEFNKRIHDGGTCTYCNYHTPTWGEEVLFLRPSPVGSEQYICKMCVKDPDIMEIVRAMR